MPGGHLVEQFVDDLHSVGADSGADVVLFIDDLLEVVGAGGIATSVAKVGATVTITVDGSAIGGISGTGTENHIPTWDASGDLQDSDWSINVVGVMSNGSHMVFTATDTISIDPESAQYVFRTGLYTDDERRFVLFTDGKHSWGNGTDPVDVHLIRRSAGILAIDGGLTVNYLSGDYDFQVNSDTGTLIFGDAGNTTVTIGSTLSQATLGVMKSGSSLTFGGSQTPVFLVQNSSSSGDDVDAFFVSKDDGYASINFGDEDNPSMCQIILDNSDDSWTFNTPTDGMTIRTGTLRLTQGTTTVPPLTFQTGATLVTTPIDGTMEMDDDCFYGTVDAGNRGIMPVYHLIRQDSTYTLTSSTSAQKLFNASTNGRITLEAGTYRFRAQVFLTSMSGTSGNATFDWTGTASTGGWLWHGIGRDIASDGATGTWSGSWSSDATLVAAPLFTAAANTAMECVLEGTFEVTSGGTMQLRITLQTAAAAVVGIGSLLEVWRIGSTSLASVGQWD